MNHLTRTGTKPTVCRPRRRPCRLMGRRGERRRPFDRLPRARVARELLPRRPAPRRDRLQARDREHQGLPARPEVRDRPRGRRQEAAHAGQLRAVRAERARVRRQLRLGELRRPDPSPAARPRSLLAVQPVGFCPARQPLRILPSSLPVASPFFGVGRLLRRHRGRKF
jgi:hypothetical protein